MFEKILFIGAWVFGTIGLVSFILGIYLANDYENSIEKMIDATRGVRRSYHRIIRFGMIAFISSLIVLIAHYI